MRKITNSVIIEKLGQTDKVINIAKLNIESELIKKDSISFMTELINRKITNSYKNKVVDFIQSEKIIFINNDSIPNYLAVFPTKYRGSLAVVVNINSLVISGDKDIDIVKSLEPRVFYSLALFALIQYLIVVRYDEITKYNSKFNKIFLTTYKKLFYKVANKLLNVEIMADNIKDTYEALLTYFIQTVLFEKDKKESFEFAISNVSRGTPPSFLTNTIDPAVLEKIISFDTFIDAIGETIPQVKDKCKSITFIKEYTMFYRTNGALSIDLIQYFIPMLVSANSFSGNFFADLAISKALDKDLKTLDEVIHSIL